MNVTLPFISLCYEQIRDMPANAILVADRIATEDFLKTVQMSTEDQ